MLNDASPEHSEPRQHRAIAVELPLPPITTPVAAVEVVLGATEFALPAPMRDSSISSTDLKIYEAKGS